MKFFIALTLILAVASAGILRPAEPNLEGRITNGELARVGQFPYQVGLNLVAGNASYFCGGTLIDHRWVVTAAHCTDSISSVTVVLGATDIKNKAESGQQRVWVSKENILVHEGWNPELLLNDISLIKLPVYIEYNELIQPATLPEKSDSYSTYEGDSVWASGWGRDSDASQSISQNLRYIEVPVCKQTTCNRYYFGMVNKSNICITSKGGKSTCNGDSGGPLVKREGDKNILIGATSFGIAFGCEKGWPGVFTRITSYLDWIELKTGVVNNGVN